MKITKPPKKISGNIFLFLLPILLGGALFLIFQNNERLPLAEARSLVFYRFPVHLNAGPSEDAIVQLEAKLRANPVSALDWAELAGLYFREAKATGKGQWLERSERAASRSLELLPYWNHGALLTLARAAEYRHDFSRALELAGRIEKDQPGNPEVASLRITTYLAQGRWKEAEEIADRLVLTHPTLPALGLRAMVQEHLGRKTEAWTDYLRALKSEDIGDPEGSAWLRGLIGRFLHRHGEKELAQEFIAEARRIHPGYPVSSPL